ncbi:hypothetical protein BC829DRAFT_205710 [Chytridium lagenaria]|nr:hypothetical protein BC829DRAFT_205710 [Chytridium lagenaria]
MEKLILCIALSIQRLEFACEVKAFYIPQEVHSSFEHLVEAQLPCLTSEDPYLQQLISSTSETIKWLTSTRVEAEELMASPVALSLLSQITRMTPPNNILSLADPFFGILADLKEKNEWYLGRKFIRLLATSALMNADACALFITLVKRLDNKRCWQWIYMGLLSLGAIVLTSPYAPVRKLALDQGLLFFLKLKELETENLEEDNFWKTRSAAILVLQEIYVCRRSDPMAIMILESLKEQKQLEEHPFIKKQLNNTVPGETTTHGRLFFFSSTFALLSRNRIQSLKADTFFLRKYLKTTDRKGISIMKKSSSRFPHKKATPTKKGKTEKLSKPRRFWDEKSNEGGFHHDEHDEGNDEASRFLSDHPYHYNYKDNTTIVTKCKLDEEDVETIT